MIYKKLVNIIDEFLYSKKSKGLAEKFCNMYMDIFYDVCDELEKEVTKMQYDIFDDINLLCDLYEDNDAIRESDPNCIDEIKLREKLKVLRQKINIIFSN